MCPCVQCVRLLLRDGCDPAMSDNDGLTPDRLADLCGHRECADLIRRSDATGRPRLLVGLGYW